MRVPPVPTIMDNKKKTKPGNMVRCHNELLDCPMLGL